MSGSTALQLLSIEARLEHSFGAGQCTGKGAILAGFICPV
jgi:hypothetical protein